MPPRKNDTSRRKGFTLIEILTATTIMIILIVVVLTVAVQVFSAYDSAVSNLATTAESRGILSSLEQDLQSAIMRDDNNIWLQVEHPEDIGNISKSNAPKLMFFATVVDRLRREGGTGSIQKIEGDVCAVNYEIAQRSPFDNPGELVQQIYGLYRAIVDSQATFDTALPIITGSSGAGASPTAVITGQDPRIFWEGTAEVIDIDGIRSSQSLPLWTKELQNFHASNIVSLNYIFWYYNSKLKEMEVAAHQDISSKLRTAYSSAKLDVNVEGYNDNLKVRAGQIILDDNASDPIQGVLKRVDIIVTILSPEGAEILKAEQKQQGSAKISTEKFDTIVEKHGRVFSRSVIVYQ